MVPTPFFCTGLPRSRTAWVANWLTTGHTVCYHDRPYSRDLLQYNVHVGFAGPETATDFDKARKDFPNAPWLVINRNSREAFLAFTKWAGNDLPKEERAVRDFWTNREQLLADIMASTYTAAVPMTALDNIEMARRIWSHLRIEGTFDALRWKMLTELNVQQDKKKGTKRWRLAQ